MGQCLLHRNIKSGLRPPFVVETVVDQNRNTDWFSWSAPDNGPYFAVGIGERYVSNQGGFNVTDFGSYHLFWAVLTEEGQGVSFGGWASAGSVNWYVRIVKLIGS